MKMTDKDREPQVKRLARDFAYWGLEAIRNIRSLTQKHGVLCSADTFSDGEKG